MIQKTITFNCRKCSSSKIVKNGRNRSGNQQYFCRQCGAAGVLQPKLRYSESRKREILCAYEELRSIRAISRRFGVSRKTLSNWLKDLPCGNLPTHSGK